MAAPSGQDIAQHIAAGDLDGELVDLLEVIQARFMEGASSMRWVISFDGLEVAEDDLTLDEAWVASEYHFVVKRLLLKRRLGATGPKLNQCDRQHIAERSSASVSALDSNSRNPKLKRSSPTSKSRNCSRASVAKRSCLPL